MADRDDRAGVIAVFARHPKAANLLMAILVVLGVFALMRINTQFFPTIEVPRINVSVAWTGAGAEDVEKNILKALEPELRFLDGLDKIVSYAREGSASVRMEFEDSADMNRALSDVETAVAGITTLPDGAEEPVIQRVTFYERVARVAVAGPFTESALKEYARRVRDALLEAGIDKVALTGSRDPEIWVEIDDRELRRLGLTRDQVADRVAEGTADRPSGTLEGAVERQVRALGRDESAAAIADIELVARVGGDRVRLGDVARVHETFDRDDPTGLQKNQPAIELTVQRAVNADTLRTARIMHETLDAMRPTLPPSLRIEIYDVGADRVIERIGLLVKNGIGGLALVLLILFIFLNARIAFWVAVGIPVAMMATVFVMWMSGQTINMISLFALILTLGIVVDDAIVVGEHTATRQALGDPPDRAAEAGAMRMMTPVLAATLTTVAAFGPIFLVSGRIGDVMEALPLVVIAVLIASLVECFLILPGHLSHQRIGKPKPGSFRRGFDRRFAAFRDGPFRAAVAASFNWRYTVIAVSVGAFLIAAGMLAGGRVGFQFFPTPESENIFASVTFGAGTPRDEVIDGMRAIEDALGDAERELSPDGTPLVVSRFTTLGKSRSVEGDNVARMDVQLVAAEDRTIRTRDVLRAWRRALPSLPNTEKVAISARRGGPPGRDIDIRLEGGDVATLKRAAEDAARLLAGYPGVSGIEDELPYGKDEIILSMTPRGAALGFTAETVGAQVRAALSGAVAKRFARDDEEVLVRVLSPSGSRGIDALRRLTLIGPDGRAVPLTEAVSLTQQPGFSLILRRDGRSSVSVTADVDQQVIENGVLVAALDDGPLAELAARHGIDYRFSGRAEERAESFADLRIGLVVALTVIYIILAWVFASYARPLIVIAIVPFGFVGAVAGHYLLDFSMTILSMIGLLGLAGILVNDSIILVSRLDERLRDGEDLHQATIGAAQDRLRAVLLTSLTTIGGLVPLLFERSLQAQFLMPMAITIVFGLAAATFLVLFLVPALIGMQHDVGAILRAYGRVWVDLFRRFSGARRPA